MVVSFLGFHKSVGVCSCIGKVPEVHLPASESAPLSMTAEVGNRQKAAKKQNTITLWTTEWPSGLASMVVKQLFDKFKQLDTVSLIDMN